jgi:hypothetical protein
MLTGNPAADPTPNRGGANTGDKKMTEQEISTEKMATAVGIIETDDVFVLRRRLDALTGQAMEMAGFIVSQTSDIKAIWDRLTPVIYDVQAMLSQHCSRRQERRARGLPTWQEWRKTFLADSGLDVSERTAQRHLKALRELKTQGPKKPGGRSGGTTPMERYQILHALHAANALRDALLEEDDPSDALANFVDTNISSDRLQQMMANCPRPREASSIGAAEGRSGDAFSVGPISLRFHHPGLSSECGIDFQPGAWAILAEYITVEHRQQFEAVFAPLSMADKHQAFKNFIIAIAKTVIHMDDDKGALQLPGESHTEDREPLQAT